MLEKADHLPPSETSGFGSPCSRDQRRVQDIDVDAHVDSPGKLRCYIFYPAASRSVENFFGPPWLKDDAFSGPTLIIHDELDEVVPFEHAKHAAELMSESEIMTVDAGGHLIWIGQDSTKMHLRRLSFLEEYYRKVLYKP